nr:hypothetical protein [Tanacetum cinerariifolium]
TVRTTAMGRTYQSRVPTGLPVWWYFWLGGGLMITLGIGLYHLIPRIFTVVAGPPTKLTQLDREETALTPRVTVAVHHYWLIPGGSDWRDAARWFVKLLPTPHPQVEDIFDCRLLFAEQNLGKSPKTSPKKSDKITDKARFKNLLQTVSESSISNLDATSPIVLTHFDYRSGDALVTQQKRQSIESLLLIGRPLLILSSIHPMGFSDCGPTAAPEIQQRVRESGFELLDVLSNFRLQYFSLRWLNQPRMLPGLESTPVDAVIKPEELKAAVTRVQALLFKDDQLLQKFFDKECGAFPFVEALRDDVLGALWRQRALEHEEASRLLTLNNDAQRALDKLAREKSDDTA